MTSRGDLCHRPRAGPQRFSRSRRQDPPPHPSRGHGPRGEPAAAGAKKLWRVRVGDYRILYSIEEARWVVLVVKIGHRREVYRGEL